MADQTPEMPAISAAGRSVLSRAKFFEEAAAPNKLKFPPKPSALRALPFKPVARRGRPAARRSPANKTRVCYRYERRQLDSDR